MVTAKEKVFRFNSLPYRSVEDTAFSEQALVQLNEQAKAFPLTALMLKDFCASAGGTVPNDRRPTRRQIDDGHLRHH